MLVQSGAIMPDDQMVRALESHHRIVAFSGIPTAPSNGNFAPALRLAAARGGCEKIMVYWGILETAQKDLSAKTISWVPIVGGIIPDEDVARLAEMGVARVYTPKDFELNRIMLDIVGLVGRSALAA